MRKNIEKLINSGISPLRVSKATGIPQNTCYRIFNGEASLDNITLRNAELLNNYYEEMGTMKKVTIEKRNNYDHIVGEEYEVVYGEYEESSAKEAAWEIANEYESSLNENGHELDDQDKMNDIEAITNLHVGEYDFNCGDYTYYITIEEF